MNHKHKLEEMKVDLVRMIGHARVLGQDEFAWRLSQALLTIDLAALMAPEAPQPAHKRRWKPSTTAASYETLQRS